MNVMSRRQVESMCRSPHPQTHGQPYTRIERIALPNVQATPGGPVAYKVFVYQVTGYTFEMKWDGQIEEWANVTEEHDLGQASTLPVAKQVAGEWRDTLVGEYPIA